jgi:hypothetical protein
MKKNKIILSFISSGIVLALMTNGCASVKLTERGGAQLWSENCVRCHNAPPPNAFTSEQWETINMHMRIRAGLTEDEVEKITEFLKSAN